MWPVGLKEKESMTWFKIAVSGYPRRGEFDWVSEYVLVSDGFRTGIGSYDFDRKVWTYEFCGHNEQDDNRIVFWMYLPERPSV